MNDKSLVVISYYDRRPINNLLELIGSFSEHPAGDEFDVCVVVNRTNNEVLCVSADYPSIFIHYRHNIGMNIGAWDYGWRIHPGYANYLFLQDECYVIRNDWLLGYRSVLENPEVGMVGESVNSFWDKPWPELRELFSKVPLPEHRVDSKTVNRVDFYLKFFREHGVRPGPTGKHLRSVVWFFPGAVLKEIDGFLIGRNYGECIAAEIATSKKVEALGLGVVQANQQEEFFYIRHLEYNQDSPGSPYAHDVKYVDYASVRRLLEAKEEAVWPLLKFKVQRLLRLNTIK
jgi:hypothetical protein